MKYSSSVLPLQNTRFLEKKVWRKSQKITEHETPVLNQDWVYLDHPYTRHLLLMSSDYKNESEVTPDPAAKLWVSCVDSIYLRRSSRTDQAFIFTSIQLRLPRANSRSYIFNKCNRFIFFLNTCKPLVFLWQGAPWAIPVWRAISFWPLPPSYRYLWILALEEAVKNQSHSS